MRIRLFAAVAAAALLQMAAPCGLSAQTPAETKLYNKTLKKPSVKAYDKFLKKYPDGSYSLEILRLRDTELFDLSPDEQNGVIQWLYFNLDMMRTWTAETLEQDLDALLKQDDTHRLLKANYYDDICWFNKEAADMLTDLIRISGYYLKVFDPAGSAAEQTEDTLLFEKAADLLAERIAAAEYQYDRLIPEDAESGADEAPFPDEAL